MTVCHDDLRLRRLRLHMMCALKTREEMTDVPPWTTKNTDTTPRGKGLVKVKNSHVAELDNTGLFVSVSSAHTASLSSIASEDASRPGLSCPRR